MNAQPTHPLVSVVVLAYNHEPFIRRAIDSILSQRLDGPMELIIAEDASQDGTLSIAREYEALFPTTVRVITSSNNVGMHANHRRAVLSARGDFIAYCEGDDFWNTDDKLQQQVEILREDPALAGVHTDFDHLIDREPPVRRRRYATRVRGVRHHATRYEDLLERNVIQTCTLMLHRDTVVEYLGSAFGLAEFAVEDWPICLYATHTGRRIAFLPETTATYRKVAGSVTNSTLSSQVRRVHDQHRMISQAATDLTPSPNHEATGHEVTDEALMVLGLLGADSITLLDAARRLRHSPRRARRFLSRCGSILADRALLLRGGSFLARRMLTTRDRLLYR